MSSQPPKRRSRRSSEDQGNFETGLAGSKVERALDARLLRKGYRFSAKAADHVCKFFEELLVHSKGEWAGKAFKLAPWQRAKLRRLFGWRRPDGTRRYRRTYWWVPRKNGKSTIAAGIALYLAGFDDEAGAEVYSAAADKEQALIVFDEAKKMAAASLHITSMTQVFKEAVYFTPNGGRYRPITSKAETKHGLNVHGVVIDEVHAFKSRALYDVLTTASASRRQPMEVVISTAGDNVGSFAYELWEYSIKCRDGIIEDPEFMSVVYCADESDDWESPETWRKANPNLGISFSEEKIAAAAKKARDMPGGIQAFKQLYLNIWSQSVKAWLDVQKWRGCAAKLKLEQFAGRRCWAGLDLSKTTDLTALALVFPSEDQLTCDAMVLYWCPQENAQARAKKDKVQYPKWIADGHIRATPGDIVDYRWIRRDLQEIVKLVDVQEIAYDRWNAPSLVQQLQDDDGMVLAEFGQGYMSMSTPAHCLERLILGKLIRHDGNPVTTWQVSNVVVRRDPAGNIKPDKSRSRERIDGVVALVMALGRASLAAETGSVYEHGGIKTL